MSGSKAITYAETLVKLIKDIKTTYEYNESLIEQYEKETQDLLHEIELGNFAYKRGNYLAKEIRNVRQKRRKALDENASMKYLYEYFDGKTIANDLQRALGNIRKEESRLENRVYYPRVRSDLTIATKDPSTIEKALTNAK